MTILWQSFCGLLIVTELTYDENEYAQLTVKVFYSVCAYKTELPAVFMTLGSWHG